jgi:hypothetical protein
MVSRTVTAIVTASILTLPMPVPGATVNDTGVDMPLRSSQPAPEFEDHPSIELRWLNLDPVGG